MSNEYCTRTDIENQFGRDNVRLWADLDNSGDATDITTRIITAIDNASEEVDEKLRGHGYAIPIRLTGSSTTPPVTVIQIVAVLAGVWLYSVRQTNDLDSEGKPMTRLGMRRKWAERVLKEILAGQRNLNAEVDTDMEYEVDAPFVGDD